MLTLAKYCFMLCLIGLQFIAPFTHAHAFGLDHFEEHAFHLHSDALHASDANLQSVGATSVDEQPLIGAIVTVANGFKVSKAEDVAEELALLAIFFTFALLLVGGLRQAKPNYFNASYRPQHHYARQNPRAPPR